MEKNYKELYEKELEHSKLLAELVDRLGSYIDIDIFRKEIGKYFADIKRDK